MQDINDDLNRRELLQLAAATAAASALPFSADAAQPSGTAAQLPQPAQTWASIAT